MIHRVNQIKRQYFLIRFVTVLMLIAEVTTLIDCLYLPHPYEAMRRQDLDDDEMDHDASAPYQNQDDNSGAAQNDGFEDPDQDGQYEETPRDEEGQADLERFFDDHLGASERDGMDRENLPTNLVPLVMQHPQLFKPSTSQPPWLADDGTSSGQLRNLSSNLRKTIPRPSYSIYQDELQPSTALVNRYVTLPEKKLIITRQIVDDSRLDRLTGLHKIPGQQPHILQRIYYQQLIKPLEQLDTNSTEIVVAENDDFDKVYVTNVTNKPFKIAALGGYDPEEDFQDASRDIDEPNRYEQSVEERPGSYKTHRRAGNREKRLKDITFNDPEADTLFNDASETDEVTFEQDDPYQTDLEAEMHGQSSDKKPADVELDSQAAEVEQQPEVAGHRQNSRNRDYDDDDDSYGSWVNDGVDDMEVPSQSHQDTVLEKAARRDALAKRLAKDNSAQEQSADGDSPEDENQRMANADYLKNYMKVDDSDEALR